MILGKLFENDSLKLAEIQYKVYWDSIDTIFKLSFKKYMWAEAVLGLRSELGQELHKIKSIDHRTLQWLHDAIAGQFRLNFVGKQLNIFDDSDIVPQDSVELDFLCQWQNYLNEELNSVFLENPNIIRGICTTVAFKNPDKRGCQAEDSIYRFTLHKYASLLVKEPKQLSFL